MEFIILVLLFLAALGFEKAPEKKRVYTASQAVKRPEQNRQIRAVAGRRVRKLSHTA